MYHTYQSVLGDVLCALIPTCRFFFAYLQHNKIKLDKIANLISKLNFYKLIPYPMDNCFTGRRDRSRQTPEKDVLYRSAFARWRIVLPLPV